ncbi:hypothetical protein [Streptomyces sp. 2A115]|uniref:hypothetical protein n=1 Tax=Streptomyces sp. 2A115 TaxID=3457439 RepID=UPI003FCEF128
MPTNVRFLGNGLTPACRLPAPGTRARRLAEHGFDTVHQGESEGDIVLRDGVGGARVSRGVDEIAPYGSFAKLTSLFGAYLNEPPAEDRAA